MHCLDARTGRLDSKRSRRLAILNAVPEFFLSREQEVLVEGIGRDGDLQHCLLGVYDPHIVLELGHVFFGRGFLRERPGQHELGLEDGAGLLNHPVEGRRHPADHRVLDPPLYLRNDLPGIQCRLRGSFLQPGALGRKPSDESAVRLQRAPGRALYGQHPCINLLWARRCGMGTVNRNDRIELRTTKEEKRLLAAAAAYERLDVTSFIMRNVLPAAREAVDRAERIVLSERDTKRVLALLENPPRPTSALLAAARRRVRHA